MNHISKLVRHDLKFNVSRMAHKMFYIHGRISKSHLRFFLRGAETFLKIRRCISHTHAFSATAKRGFNYNRISDRFRFFLPFFYCVDWIFATRNDRNAGICHGIFCRLFVSETCDHICRRSDKCDVALLTKFCKTAVFREKSKSRVNCIGACNNCCTDDVFHAEVTLGGRSRSDADCFICKLCMQGVSVCL